MCYNVAMVKTLEKAIAEVSNLPDADQEQIGLQLLSHVEKLRRLRAEIDKGIRSLEAGKGEPLDVEDFLRRQNERHGRS
jgi:Arc/MetJ-type ribon-helix-helix transcriptional regulator